MTGQAKGKIKRKYVIAVVMAVVITMLLIAPMLLLLLLLGATVAWAVMKARKKANKNNASVTQAPKNLSNFLN